MPAFGTLALLTVLQERGALSEEELSEQRLALGRRGAWGLRPSGEELRLLAAEHDWQATGGCAQALADPAAWHSEPADQLRLNVEFLRQLHSVKPDQLDVWTARVVDLGHASGAFDADDVAVGLLVYGWLSPGAFADLEAHRPFTLALVRALRAAARRLCVAAFDHLVERAATTAIFSTDARLRGEMFKWILHQVTFLDGKLLFDFFG